MNTRYRAAVIGCGRIGVAWEWPHEPQPKPATHAGAFAQHPRATLAAMCDVKPEALARAQELFPHVPGHADYARMLEEVRPDIVAVATQVETHAEVVLAAAASGVRAIMCEKPIARDATEARMMIEACRRSGALLFVNHTRRFDPEIRAAAEEVAGGAIGAVLQGTGYYTNGLLNTGTHLVDLFRLFLGEARWVSAVFNEQASAPAGDVGIDAMIEFDSGARGMVQYMDVRDYSVFDLRLQGRRGALALTRFGYEVERTPVRERTDVAGLLQLDLDHRTRRGVPRSFMGPMAAHVIACLDGVERPLSRGEDGLAALEILTAMRASAANHGARTEIKGGWNDQ